MQSSLAFEAPRRAWTGIGSVWTVQAGELDGPDLVPALK
jgi:hypothetical protein